MKPYCRIAETVVPARAYESQVFVAYVNRIGTERELTYCGLSSIIGPDGHSILKKGPDEDGVFFADVEISAITTVRKKKSRPCRSPPGALCRPGKKIIILYKLSQLL